MMATVVDCSVALAWCFADEATIETTALLRKLRTEAMVVPGIWPLEVANTLIQAERKGRCSPSQREQFVELLGALTIDVDPTRLGRALGETLRLAQGCRLTAYDASYLELAIRRALPLATRDADLARAAGACGVGLIPM